MAAPLSSAVGQPLMNLARFLIIKAWTESEIAMQLLYYSRGQDMNNRRLETAVHKAIPLRFIEQFDSLDDFGERLRRPVEPDSIAVLSVLNRDELRRMQPLRGLLTEIFIVMIIPDRKKGTVELAHLLLPRFLSQKSDDFAALGKVLEKICRTVH